MKTRNKLLGLATMACLASFAFGMAVAPVSAQDGVQPVSETAKFEMQTGAQVRTADPAGIRFVTDVNDAYKAQLAESYPTATSYVWGTVLTCVDSDENKRTIDAVTVQWLENDTRWYTTLADIPESDYLTEITAESYVKIYKGTELLGTETVENKQTRSIAYSASWALNDGYDQDILYTYTKAIADTSVTLDKDGVAYVASGEEIQLTATVQPAIYGVAWRSSDTSVAEVDKNGKVTTKGAGFATITATLGNASDSYQIAVDYTTIDFEDGKASPAIGNELTALVAVKDQTLPDDKTFDLTVGSITANEQANKAYGVASGLETVANVQISIDYDWLKFAFSDETVTSVTMDFYYKGGSTPGFVRTGTGASTDESLAYSYDYTTGIKVYKVSVVYARFHFALLPEGQDQTITFRCSGGLTCFYVDNISTSTAAIEVGTLLTESKLVMGFTTESSLKNLITLSNADNIVSTGNTAYGTNEGISEKSLMYIYLSKQYLGALFEQYGGKNITLDIILSTGTATIQGLLDGNNTTMMQNATSSSPVSGTTYHTYTLTITKEHLGKTTASHSYMRLRYAYGGKSTFFYVDNLAIAK